MNKVILMGRLTRDPEVRYSQAAEPLAIARYTLAVDRRGRRDANGIQRTDKRQAVQPNAEQTNAMVPQDNAQCHAETVIPWHQDPSRFPVAHHAPDSTIRHTTLHKRALIQCLSIIK